MAFSLIYVYGKPNTPKVGWNSAVLKSSCPDLYRCGSMDRGVRPNRQCREDVFAGATELTALRELISPAQREHKKCFSLHVNIMKISIKLLHFFTLCEWLGFGFTLTNNFSALNFYISLIFWMNNLAAAHLVGSTGQMNDNDTYITASRALLLSLPHRHTPNISITPFLHSNANVFFKFD